MATWWRFAAGPESLGYYLVDKRPSVAAWTADKGGRVRRGDLVALYATGAMQQYVAVARVCCDPVSNASARRRRADREYWTYLQVQPLKRPVHRSAIEAQAFAVHGSGLMQPRGGRANRIAQDAIAPFTASLSSKDPKVEERIASWGLGGTGRWPRHLDAADLVWEDWAPPLREQQRELRLSRNIARRLVRGGCRYLASEDGVGPRRATSDPAGLSLEHPVAPGAWSPRIDILLVDDSQSHPTLLLIEVKVHATLATGRNPVRQAVTYRDAMQARDGKRWRIRTMIVAEHFHPEVVTQAEARGIEVRQCSSDGRLRPPPRV